MNKPEYYPIELLHWSGMEDKHLVMVENILSVHPEYINTLNNHKDNALMIASRLNNIEIVKYLLENTEIDYKHINNEGNFFMIAMKYNHSSLVKVLWENYRDKIDFSLKVSENKTFLHLAAFKGYDFIFEDKDFCNEYIFIKDDRQQSCLFDLFDGYIHHKNYWCFDLIQEYFSKEQIQELNIDKMNIFEYFFQNKLIEFSTVKNKETKEVFISDMIKESVINIYSPILNVLEQRI